jgi:hypothetical protein
MDSALSLWDLGLSFVILAVAFGFSLKAVRRYAHPGLVLLCASLGIEALANALSFLMLVLDSQGSSFLLWSSGVLRYIGVGLLLGGWISLAIARKVIGVREMNGGARFYLSMVSGPDFLRWAIVAILVISVLAAIWGFFLIFAAGMKTVPHFSGEEALTAVLPSLVLLPASIASSVLGVRWAVGNPFLALGILSALSNLACVVVAGIFHWSG